MDDRKLLRLAIVAWLALAPVTAFVVGRSTGIHAAGCVMVLNDREAFQTDPSYWTEGMRTLVESCERGEGI